MDLLGINRRIDLLLILIVILLCGYGVVAVFSATQSNPGAGSDPFLFMKKQGVAIAIGAAGLLLASILNYNRWKNLLVPLYLLNITILVIVLIIGSSHKGAQSWIEIGGFQLQPSEFSKILLIIT